MTVDRKRKNERISQQLDPTLKTFVDRVLVPILVKEYVSQLQAKKTVAERPAKAAICIPISNAPQHEVAR